MNHFMNPQAGSCSRHFEAAQAWRATGQREHDRVGTSVFLENGVREWRD